MALFYHSKYNFNVNAYKGETFYKNSNIDFDLFHDPTKHRLYNAVAT